MRVASGTAVSAPFLGKTKTECCPLGAICTGVAILSVANRGQSVEQIDDEGNELRSTVPVRRRCSRARLGLLQAGAFVLTQFADLRRAFRFASLLDLIQGLQ